MGDFSADAEAVSVIFVLNSSPLCCIFLKNDISQNVQAIILNIIDNSIQGQRKLKINHLFKKDISHLVDSQ